jgi:hypothetical protein
MNRRLVGWLLLGMVMVAAPSLAADPAPGTASPAATPTESAATKPTTGVSRDAAIAAEAARSGWQRELRTVEQDVTGLKERVFRSKATLQLLREMLLEGATAGARVVLLHDNRMGPAYTMEAIQYFLDGKNIYAKMDATGGLDQQRQIKLLEQALPPGPHNLQVNMTLRGRGFGVFSYLRTYSFKVQSSYSFSIEDGRTTTLKVIANEKGGPWRTFLDRPNVQYDVASDTNAEKVPGTASP